MGLELIEALVDLISDGLRLVIHSGMKMFKGDSVWIRNTVEELD
jgi:hypothetical protein